MMKKEKLNKNVPVIRASYHSRKEWKMDPAGFFTIKPFPEEKLVRVRYYNACHKLQTLVEGKSAEKIVQTLVRERFVSTLQHAAYLGFEIMKAEIAMKKNIPYVQDDPLKL
jgi:tetrahydromethanopterin S-methyltransferase subunit A